MNSLIEEPSWRNLFSYCAFLCLCEILSTVLVDYYYRNVRFDWSLPSMARPYREPFLVFALLGVTVCAPHFSIGLLADFQPPAFIVSLIIQLIAFGLTIINVFNSH
ncbi:hypothetical protein L3Y34_002080 [Caenorhabditis briggsae]|uniref:Uncharacterized protein n=1 Tax=Caenorhabditis briggsae TaxID=6238 RepID=A0AAE9DDX3_CAEBR|nr:hypothetical protein L3Y34_002080 [Caenorhabditis briggsae]